VTRIRVTTPSKAVGAMRLGFMCERRRRSAVVERGGGRGWGSAATSLGGRLLWVAVVWYRVRVCGLLWGRHQRPSLGYIGGSGGRGAVVGDGATRASPQCRGGGKEGGLSGGDHREEEERVVGHRSMSEEEGSCALPIT
jgi:hypothetical protein